MFTYLVNFLPFALIERVLFLYHYFPALIVSLIASARLANRIDKPYPIAIGIMAAAGAMFAWLIPVIYGLAYSPSDIENGIWAIRNEQCC